MRACEDRTGHPVVKPPSCPGSFSFSPLGGALTLCGMRVLLRGLLLARSGSLHNCFCSRRKASPRHAKRASSRGPAAHTPAPSWPVPHTASLAPGAPALQTIVYAPGPDGAGPPKPQHTSSCSRSAASACLCSQLGSCSVEQGALGGR